MNEEDEALAQTQEPDVQETLHWHAFNYRQAHIAQAHEMWEKLEQFVDCKIKVPRRTWVGLTDDERSKIWGELPSVRNEERDACIFAECIELYLKEKNNGV